MREASLPRTHSTRLSEDVVPLRDVKVNPGAVVRRATESGQPVLLTSRGRRVAVLQSLAEYEKAQDERSFLYAVVEGLASAEQGRELTLTEVMAGLRPS
ncbi:MAG: type II toxin-antitoxin system Phd/YefM family antitoxin [Acidobacteriota bacterium]|nr:type II toxin-antitoxin system Phd/YefM family antitoxin [Acidobacteriota bacterium]